MSEKFEQNGRLHYRWEWSLQASPEAFWPFFADTNRVNRDTGIFPVDELPLRPEDAGTGRRRLRFRLPLPITWLEEPFEWVAPYRYGVLRRYENGPLRTMEVLATISPQAAGGAKLVYETWIEPRNILGRLAAPVALGFIAPRRFAKAVRRYDAVAALDAPPLLLKRPYRLVPGAEGRMNNISDQLLSQGTDQTLLNRLLREIKEADDLILAHLRPYALADQWNVPRRDVLELALQATRAGLLDFQWELLCPMCRGAADRVHNHLADLETSAHCATCNLDFRADNEHAIELTFAPNPTIRPVERTEFCVAGPQQTPHICGAAIAAGRNPKNNSARTEFWSLPACVRPNYPVASSFLLQKVVRLNSSPRFQQRVGHLV